MDKKRFKSLLSPNAKEAIKKATINAERISVIYRLAADIFLEDQVGLFEKFIIHPGFARFMLPRTATSLSRFEHTIELLLKRIALGINPKTIADIAGKMSDPSYRRIEKSFFKIPVDRKSFEMFERCFISIGEQHIALTDQFLEFCASVEFSRLKERYIEERPLYEELFHRLESLLLAKRDVSALTQAASLLCDPHMVRLVYLSHNIERSKEFLLNVFNVILHHFNPAFFFKLLKLYSMRYPHRHHLSREKLSKEHLAIYRRLAEIWNYLYILTEDNINDYKAFLKDYGNQKDDFESFVWEMTFSLEAEKTVKAIKIFVSTAFTSLRGFYGYSSEIIKFLIKNIMAVITEINIRDLQSSLYRIVLKLLLGLKVERRFLERRSNFFKWIKAQTSSTLVEIEVIRFLLFEYIFIALKLVDTGNRMKMTKFCDDNHRQFCHYIDDLYSNPRYMRQKDSSAVFNPALSIIRSSIWKAHIEKFSHETLLISKIISIAETTDMEDEVIRALKEVEPEHLNVYYESLMDMFKQNPERIHEAVPPDFWCRVSLGEAIPYVKGVIMPLIGGIPILDGGTDAKTNGHVIYLPHHINFFKDPLHPLVENRNLTAYIFFALHEAGHILAGTFRFDLRFYTGTLEKPDLFFHIYNTFEDFRIENYLIKIKAHPQIVDLIHTMNGYLSANFMTGEPGIAVSMLFYIVDEAGGYNISFKTTPAYQAIIERLSSARVSTGRFRSLKEMIEYGIERLKNIDCANPLGVYPLVCEFYEIMKHWHESYLTGVLDPENYPKPVHDYDSSPVSDTPLTQEDLDALYREYNENPRKFLQRYGIIVPGEAKHHDGKIMKRSALEAIDSFAADLFETSAPDYLSPGGIDFSHRTRADDESAKVQTGEPEVSGMKSDSMTADKKPVKQNETCSRAKTGKKKYVYSIDPRTRSRTRLSEVVEFTIKEIDTAFFRKIRQWEYLAQKVYNQLSALLPILKEEEDTSSFDGEMNIELLIEVLSDRDRLHSTEFFDIFPEERRTLDVVIGLDASGSTANRFQQSGAEPVAVLDVEKAFAVILGTALSSLTERVSAYAFNSLTSTNIYRAETIEAVSSFKPLNGNRDGDFIRYINNILEKSDAEVKYFFLLSDGMPASDNYMGKEALDDTLIAMRETVNSGIKLIYFNVDIIRREYFDAFKQEATYAEHFTNPEQLLPIIPDIVGKIVDSIK